MGSEGTCPPACQKLLICSGCGGYGLKIQAEAEHSWLSQGHSLSNAFLARQHERCISLRLLINAIFAKLGHPLSDGLSLTTLSNNLITIHRHRGGPDADTRYCIERADQCESIIDENEADYLQEIGYAA